jgi:hypothetical protein
MLFNKSLPVLFTMSDRRELHTWQQIANYLGLSVRALQNYEKTAGLPVHRLAGQTRGRVWASTNELDAWKSRALAGLKADLVTMPPGDSESSPPASPSSFPFSHWAYIALVSGLYALLCAEAVILEIAYQFDRYGTKTLLAAPVVFCWVLAAFFSAVAVDWWRTAHSKAGGFFLSISIVYGSAALLQLALWRLLPTVAITEQVARQPWSAQASYLKNLVLYFLPLTTIYILLPFHFVFALQRELHAKRHDRVLALLMGDQKAVAPKNAMYLRVGWLALALFVVALLAVVMTQNLFDHLKPNPYKNLFIHLALGRTLLLFGIALLCLLWYSRTLNEIKRECLRVEILKSGLADKAASTRAESIL